MTAAAPHDPPFRADHVGSLLRPAELKEARQDRAAGKISDLDLQRLEDAAIRKAVAQQEQVGLQSITDGEFRREDFYTDFYVRGLGGVEVRMESTAAYFVDHEGRKIPVPWTQVVSRMQWRKPIYADHFRFLRSVTKRTPKVTVPSPIILHFTCGSASIRKNAYPDLDLFWSDIVDAYQKETKSLYDAGCRYLQVDDPPLATLCDERFQGMMKARGDDPQYAMRELYPEMINRAFANRPPSLHLAMHLCRGNNQSGWFGEGGYDPIAEVLFNKINVDSYFLEYESARAGDFAPLRFVPKNKSIVLGLVSSKLPQLESKDLLKRRIDEAAKYVDLDQLSLSPQCGFASSTEGNRLTEDEQMAKLRLVVEVANEVWGQEAGRSRAGSA
ncbi:MAG TPA: 5-methyltetrahydropteroyltriglutamate--homocysteine S-methyltransferase [Candidatus Polarisedimenticolia bacterium]|nr:5-methyltetrahydropteroyltriglutamate--homocysteine S-methyltransferase [Candidatus Polarisedimenticolia bacterium]